MNAVFLREFEAPTDTETLEYEVCDKDAAPVHVSLCRLDFPEPKVREFFRLTVKDRGSATKHTLRKAVIFVRRLNDLIPLPDDCGRFLGFLRSSVDRSEYYVFEARRAPTSIDSTAPETTLSRPAKEHAIGCHLRDVVACSCVFDGTTAHDGPPSEPKASEGEPAGDWGFPDELTGSGA